MSVALEKEYQKYILAISLYKKMPDREYLIYQLLRDLHFIQIRYNFILCFYVAE